MKNLIASLIRGWYRFQLWRLGIAPIAGGAKETGLGMTASIDDGAGSAQTITNDITNLTLGVPRANIVTTGIDKFAPEIILGLADLSVGLNGVFNDAVNMSHAVFKTVPSQGAAQTRAISIAISSQTLTAETMPDNYALTRAADGNFTWVVNLANADGVIPAWSA